ncbi:MAG: c-type cytochrome [Proteobacteria bacterium]|nr:c-type cytochrome [Pseudomonadota bacterium]
MIRAALLTLPLLMVSLTALAVGDASRGADSFDSNCAECHSVAKTLKNKKGPTLFGIFGRPAASIAGFDYSPALKAAGFAWNTEKLDLYVTAPKKLVPDGKMKFDGLGDAGERADLLSFLAEQK